MILPSGGYFFPDFVVSVRGRSTPDEIVLVEIKGSHNDNTDESFEKIAVRHRRYEAVQWAQRDGEDFLRLVYVPSANRIVPQGLFEFETLLRTTG